MIPTPPTFANWDEEQLWALANLPKGFPNLLPNGFKREDVTSPWVIHYNCVAYAAKDETRWWWPSPLFPGAMYTHWPPALPRETTPTVENFFRAFEILGYKECSDGKPEFGFEKVAIYVDSNDVPTHMARELGDGIWQSKLGNLQDIQHHNLDGLEGSYGTAQYFMRKPLAGHSSFGRLANRLLRRLGLTKQ